MWHLRYWFALGSFVLAAGCTSHAPQPYPQEWPTRLASGGGCNAIAGRYKEMAVVSTHMPAKNPDLGLEGLARLIMEGIGPEVSASATIDVEVGTSGLSAKVHTSEGMKRVPSTATWECRPEGIAVLRFKEEPTSAGEGMSDTTRQIVLELQRASDQSLIVKRSVTHCGKTILFMPVCMEEEVWMRFARAE